MAYTKTNWVNNSVPAINATNLNNIEEGIFQAHKNIDNIKVPKVENTKSTSTEDTYSCSYINNNFNVNCIDEEIFPTNEFLNEKRVYAYRYKISQAFTANTEYTFDLPFADQIDFAWIDLSNSYLDNSSVGENYNVWTLGSGMSTFCFNVGIKNKNQISLTSDDSWGNNWTFTIAVKFIMNS